MHLAILTGGALGGEGINLAEIREQEAQSAANMLGVNSL